MAAFVDYSVRRSRILGYDLPKNKTPNPYRENNPTDGGDSGGNTPKPTGGPTPVSIPFCFGVTINLVVIEFHTTMCCAWFRSTNNPNYNVYNCWFESQNPGLSVRMNDSGMGELTINDTSQLRSVFSLNNDLKIMDFTDGNAIYLLKGNHSVDIGNVVRVKWEKRLENRSIKHINDLRTKFT